jgi:hypothetical protein
MCIARAHASACIARFSQVVLLLMQLAAATQCVAMFQTLAGFNQASHQLLLKLPFCASAVDVQGWQHAASGSTSLYW